MTLLPFIAAAALLLAATVQAASPGIQGASGNLGPVFNLTAQASYISQPDGQMVYSWGYGCADTNITFLPAMPNNNCPSMQIPGPTLIVTEGQTVTVTLTNNLPAAAGSTSILFPGFQVSTTNGIPGLLTQEAAPSYNPVNSVTYTFVASTPGTHTYYSGTQSDLQVEMGMYGALIVLPKTVPGNCTTGLAAKNLTAEGTSGETDFRLAKSAYDHPDSCYDREYLFQFSEMDPAIHSQAAAQANNACAITTGCMQVATEPYHPAYFMVNGRSMPDDMDANYAPQYLHQPYNGNPHMHPGELVLLRVIGDGRWQHPFHEHGNHVRVLARDGNLILSQTDATKLAGPLLFTTTTTPGLAMDGIFYWTGRGLNWDVYGHGYSGDPVTKTLTCDANGYFTADPTAPNYYEWCADHDKALEVHPFGNVASGGPVTLPDPNYMTNGNWFGGSPYLGPDATVRATSPTGTTPPSGTVANPPGSEAGFAYMWHSHNEREITTNNIFPGGMMMMMLVDPRVFVINEAN
jgi:FtsP/CotA-like multicopper oxidase with cupredoxin domain